MELWIARDACGYQQLYVERPIKKNGYFERVPNTGWYTISCNLYPEITFENSPKRIKIELMED